jgi:uncharacterized membrane protein
MRGLAVLVMIEAHVLDSWTRVSDRQSWQFTWAVILGGLGAPLFLFLAGTSVALSAGSKVRRTGDAGAAARAVMQRGLWVYGLAFLFRVQSWILGWGPPRTLLRVDILNIMGPTIMAAAALWGGFRTPRARALAFGGATLAVALLTPMVRTTHILDALPDALEAYIRPTKGLSNFCIFPWAGFLFAGALVGVFVDEARTRAAETRLNVWFFASGAALALGAYAASFLPSAFGPSAFWGGSPAFFLLRAGLITAAVAVVYAWHMRPTANRWSPVQQLGRTSLFIYWIHVEMVYGLISLPIHKGLSHRGAWAAFGAFTAFMLLCSVAKDRIVVSRRGGGHSAAAPVLAPH